MATHADAEDVERIRKKLEEIIPAVKGAVTGLALEVKGKIAKAPRNPGDGRKMRFSSKRQWLFVMKSLQEGLMDSPYRRASRRGARR